ncbi:hypothetical protein MTO96_050788 [Rhipicephalus appendiculatus]
MIIPFLTPNERVRRAHIPEGVWYDFEMDSGAPSVPLISEAGGDSHTLQRRGTRRVLLLLRGGHVLPVSATPPAFLRGGHNPEYSLRVALDGQYQAKGSVYCDDGVSAGSYETGAYGLADIFFNKDTLLVVPRHSDFPCRPVRETVITDLELPLNKTSMIVLHWKRGPANSQPRTDNASLPGSPSGASISNNSSPQALVYGAYSNKSLNDACGVTLSMNISANNACVQTK